MLKVIKDFWNEEEGLGTLEVVLILVIVLGMAVIFKDQILGFFKELMGQVESNTSEFKDIKDQAK